MKLHHRRRNGNSALGSIFFEAMRACRFHVVLSFFSLREQGVMVDSERCANDLIAANAEHLLR